MEMFHSVCGHTLLSYCTHFQSHQSGALHLAASMQSQVFCNWVYPTLVRAAVVESAAAVASRVTLRSRCMFSSVLWQTFTLLATLSGPVLGNYSIDWWAIWSSAVYILLNLSVVMSQRGFSVFGKQLLSNADSARHANPWKLLKLQCCCQCLCR